jgi:hypothetical protein
MRARYFAGFAATAILLWVGTLLAHHSASNYETDKLVTLQGTVTNFRFGNPHPVVYFQAKDAAGNMAEWIAESGAPPARWYNSGWRANALKSGDEITITGGPAKDGRKMLRIRKIVSPGGKEWTEGAAAQ